MRSRSEELAGLGAEVIRYGALRRAVDTTKGLVADAQTGLQEISVNKFVLAMQEVGNFLSNTVDQFAAAA